MGTTSFDARIAVGDKCALEQLMRIIKVKVMNNAVAECRTEYFALLGIVNDESIWKARPRNALKADRRTVAPCCPSELSSIAGRRTFSSCAWQRRRMLHIGRRAVAGVLACILPFFSEYYLLLSSVVWSSFLCSFRRVLHRADS